MEMLHRDEWPALFPDQPAGSIEDVRRRMGGLQFTQSADERRHFTLLAPPGFRWRPLEEAQSPDGLLVSLVRPLPETVEIAVFADDVAREVSPAEWALHRLERDGHALWARREAATPIGTMADLLTRKEGPHGAVIARTNMAKDGKRIFTVSCQAGEQEYPQWASDFYVTLASFKLLHPEQMPLAEKLASYCYLHPAVVGFSYPDSWTVAEEALSESECDVRLDAAAGDRGAGSIHLSARADVRPRKLVADHWARLARQGIQLGDRPELAPRTAPDGFLEASSLTATGEQDGQEVEVRAMVLATEKATLLLGTHGPTRARSAVDWMVLKRAFELVRDTVYAV